MSALRTRQELVLAAWRTWGPKGFARRFAYELATRAGRVRAAEERWKAASPSRPQPLRSAGIVVPTTLDRSEVPVADEHQEAGERTISLYGGGLEIAVDDPIPWHRHPVTGHANDPGAHWSTFSDGTAEAGDVKDLWDRSRLGWLARDLHRWAATGEEASAERIWSVIEDWQRANPPYRGPNWMCGQETSLRSITTMFLADALRESTSSTAVRQELVASMVRDAVGRVRPTLGYALSQRNNHAISEAGFLWTASLLALDLPDASSIRAAASDALAEAVADQFADDGSYAQHSPTYQRLALHVLLWVLAVSRSAGEPAPEGVAEAVRASAGFLSSLVAPGSEGQVPNLGNNDGALLFDLAGTPISDLRPVIVHAAAATGQVSPFGPGPWDAEAAWFGLDPLPERRRAAAQERPRRASINVHPLTRGGVHAVLRAGPLRHRPGHADQLHTDVWIDGEVVALDAGSYRYTALAPWANALAGEEVHNTPTRPGSPQAVRSGRFFWRTWREATVSWSFDGDGWTAQLVTLTLADRTAVERLVAVSSGLVVVADRASAPVTVRWNLPVDTSIATCDGSTTAGGGRWKASFVHDDRATSLERTEDDPASGWHSRRYAELLPLTALLLPVDSGAASVFTRSGEQIDLGAVARGAAEIDLDGGSAEVVDELERLVPVNRAGER